MPLIEQHAQKALTKALNVIDVHQPGLAPFIQPHLDVLLRERYTHPDQRTSWLGGSLNSLGTPIEFTFSSLDNALRYVVEVGSPAVSPSQRLAHCAHLLSELGETGTHALPALIQTFQTFQAGTALDWGAWLGVRHHHSKTAHKIYAQVKSPYPSALQTWRKSYLKDFPLANDHWQLQAVGQVVGSKQCEFYFDLKAPTFDEKTLSALLQPMSAQAQAAPLLDLMRALQSNNRQGAFPQTTYGFSYALTAIDQQPIISIFATSDGYIGGDLFVRRRVLDAAARYGWDFSSYAAFTAPIARDLFSRHFHNVLGFLIFPNGKLGFHVSLSPVFKLPGARGHQ